MKGFVMASRGAALVLAAVVYLATLSSAHGRRILRSNPASRAEESFSQWSQRTSQTSPKRMTLAEAQRVSSLRWNHTQSLALRATQGNRNGSTVPSSSRVFYATDYGADPTGATDSTDALLNAINDAFLVRTVHKLMPGINDLGGAEIHLEGGNYLVSRPLRLPSNGGGNVLIHGGTLRASSNFSMDRYLIELWPSTSERIKGNAHQSISNDLYATVKLSSNQAGCYEDITLRDLMLDANFRGGGILVIDSIRTSIDNCYISHFTSQGIMVQRGHETYIRNSFLGQHITAGGDPDEKRFGGVAINLMGNDNAVTDVVIFSASVGIAVSGQANIFTGVHCYNKATGFGGIGIHLQLPGLTQTRIIGCYMDYTGIVAEDPVQLDISNSFFLGDAYILLKSSTQRVISGLNIVDNMFSGSNKGISIVQLDQSGGQFSSIDQTVVDRNNVRGMVPKSTMARGTVRGDGTTWVIDFSNVLLFPNLIKHVQYSFYTSDASFPKHALRSVSHNKVVIESDSSVSATIAVAVDQTATYVSGNNLYS